MEALLFLQNRKSPRAFDPYRPVTGKMLRDIIEAFRWAPSSFNKQPWRLVVVERKEQLQHMHEVMSAWNRSWVTRAPVLIAVLGNPDEQDEPDGRPQYMMDCGLAIGNMLLTGCAMDLAIHAIIGWSEEKVKGILGVPDPFRVVALIAVGHPGKLEDMPKEVQTAERRPPQRKEVKDFVFRERFGDPFA